jgi:hypothetical protein
LLDHRKARLLLWALLASGTAADRLEGHFLRRGSH